MTFDDLHVAECPMAKDRAAILDALVLHNANSGPSIVAAPLAVLIRGPVGAVIGGLWGITLYDWLQVELLVVPESMRGVGLGRKLIAKAEEAAQARGCVGVWLDTFSFQAPGFYERLGYRTLATIKDHPIGGARHVFAKRLDRSRG
jgi:GNAT superfamily N-acetyltransferase